MAFSQQFTVLKVTPPFDDESDQEADALEVWNGDALIKVIDARYTPWDGCAFNRSARSLPSGILLFDWDLPGMYAGTGAIEVWASDGSADGTVLLATYGGLRCGDSDWEVIGRVGFIQEVCGAQRWRIVALGGTVASTFELRSSISSPPPYALPFYLRLGDRIVYPGTNEAKGRELWISDGTRPGTRLVQDIRPGPEGSDPLRLVSRRGGTRVRFTADDGTGRAWWITDGTRKGTRKLDEPCCP